MVRWATIINYPLPSLCWKKKWMIILTWCLCPCLTIKRNEIISSSLSSNPLWQKYFLDQFRIGMISTLSLWRSPCRAQQDLPRQMFLYPWHLCSILSTNMYLLQGQGRRKSWRRGWLHHLMQRDRSRSLCWFRQTSMDKVDQERV